MTTIVLSPVPSRAIPHLGLLSSTVHIVQPDGPWSCPEVSRPQGTEGFSTAQLPAHHVSIVQVPAVITDGAPGALVKDLHSPGAASTPIHQAELSAAWGERNGKGIIGRGEWEGSSGPVSPSPEQLVVFSLRLQSLLVLTQSPWTRVAPGSSLVSYSRHKRIIRLKTWKKQAILSWK